MTEAKNFLVQHFGPDCLALAWTIFLALLLILQLALKTRVIRHMRQPLSPLIEDANCPPAIVVLCLRGGDPFLHHSLGRLIHQDYPRYRVRIVVDSPEDSAQAILSEAIGEVSGIASAERRPCMLRGTNGPEKPVRETDSPIMSAENQSPVQPLQSADRRQSDIAKWP
jgi:cellulose synthase/poly-beta-1,6-N-acetylglucosamine synthase-like glycosyltransferase